MRRTTKIALWSVMAILAFFVGYTFFASRTTQLKFRVTDASTGASVPGATVTIEKRGQLYYFYRRPHTNDIGQTDTNGMFTINVVRSDIVYFRAPQHRGAYAGFVEHGKIGIGPNPSRDAYSMSTDQKVVSRDGVITVPLLPTSCVSAY